MKLLENQTNELFRLFIFLSIPLVMFLSEGNKVIGLFLFQLLQRGKKSHLLW